MSTDPDITDTRLIQTFSLGWQTIDFCTKNSGYNGPRYYRHFRLVRMTFLNADLQQL